MPKILIVDDEWLTRLEIEGMLTDLGYDVAGQAETGAEAVAMARELTPDLILMDVKMPGEMNGIDAAREIKRELKTPIVFVSGYGDPEYIEAAKGVAPFGYVMKPFDEREVHAFVEIALSRRKLELELETSRERLEQTNLVLQKEIAARKRTEMVLRESEEKYSKLFHSNPQWLHITTLEDGRYVEVNDAVKEITGYERDEIIGRTSKELGLWADYEERSRLAKVALEQGGFREQEVTLIKKNGEPVSALWSAATIETMGMVSFINSVADISERKQAENKLKESEERFRMFFEQAGDAVFVHNLEEQYVEVNERACSSLGYSKDELMAISAADIEVGWEPKDLHELWENLKANKVITTTGEQRRKDGSTFPVEVRLRSIQRDDQKLMVVMARDISFRKQAEEALRESEEKYRSLYERMRDGFGISDMNGKIIEVNKAFAKIVGYTERELHGLANSDITPRKWLSKESQIIEEQVLKRGYSDLYEKEYIRKNGSIVPVELRAIRIKDETGNPSGVWVIVRNISERKQIEDNLQRYVHDLAERVKELNCLYSISNLVEKPDISLNEIIQGIVELIPSSWQYPEITYARILLGDKEYKTENFEETNWKQSNNIVVHGKRAGVLEICYLEERHEIDEGPFLNEERNMIKAITERLGRIVERKQAEEALLKSEEKYRSMMESMNDRAYICSPDFRVEYMNPAMVKRTSRNAIGGHCFKAINGLDDKCPWCIHDKVQQRENCVTEIVSPKDSRTYSVSHSPIYHVDGSISKLGIYRDITEIRNMERQLQEVQKMEAIVTLAGGVAHEFNNSLVGIMGHIELLQMNLPEDEGRNKSLETMSIAGQRMSRLTDQLLAYAEGGKYQPKNLKLDDFVIETLPILQHGYQSDIRVETHFEKDISCINADNAQMQMALSVILNNSNEAMGDEGLIRITVENKDVDDDFVNRYPGLKPGSYVCLTVEDDGKGMDEETKSGIFEPFFTTKFQGRGMGMAAVYGMVKNHGGWIYVDSELGKGTTVRIYFPAVEIAVEELKEPETGVVKGTGTILMIEDEDVVIEVTQVMLEMLGYRVMVAKTGKDAIHIAETFDGQIDLALLDIKLPDIDGRNLYPLIMKARSNLKVIVCSGYSIDGPAREILDAGAQDFIQKPFSIATLSEKLKEVLKRE